MRLCELRHFVFDSGVGSFEASHLSLEGRDLNQGPLDFADASGEIGRLEFSDAGFKCRDLNSG